MNDKVENTKNENWRVVLPSLSKDFDLAFCEWSWGLLDRSSTEEAVVHSLTPREARQFYDECLAVESEYVLVAHDGGDSPTGAVFFRRVVNESPELAFLVKQLYPFDVELPNGERKKFHPKGWELLVIAQLQKDGSVHACPYSEITRPVYVFESRGKNLHWLLIKPGVPLKAESLSAQAAADWFAKAGLEQPNSVQDVAGVERLTPDDLVFTPAKSPTSDGIELVRSNDNESANVFRLEGDTWTVRFNSGKVQRGISNGRAPRDIYYLLQHAGKPVPVFKLPGNRDAGGRTGSPGTQHDLEYNEGMMRNSGSVAMADSGDLAQMEEQILDRKQQLNSEKDHTVRVELEDEIDNLKAQIRQNFSCHTKDRKPRKLKSSLEKSQEATWKAIQRWIRAKATEMPELINHLRKSLDRAYASDGGPALKYAPAMPIEWDLGEY